MKKLLFALLIIAMVFAFGACASKPAPAVDAEPVVEAVCDAEADEVDADAAE